VLQKRLLPRSGFGAAISVSIARHSMVLCNSVSADRFVLAASRFLAAAVACVILVSCAAESRESYWSGCVKVAMVSSQYFFSQKLALCVKVSMCKNVCVKLPCGKVSLLKNLCVKARSVKTSVKYSLRKPCNTKELLAL
jgi:hypothetical protein